MQYASLDGILRTILTIVCIYYLLKFIGKLLFPIMVKTVVDKAQENFHQQQQSYQRPQNNQSDFVNTNSKSDKPREKKKVGEYIDYEEID
ncbi:DUF4834 family protein [Flavobacterium qiangtangense]|uniref:DUF4834 family protein n=1 Tax=Flavobacterium qiangtangense TaxID=1442595 RepID=A0ABW1PMZ3_9FLAO